MSRFQSVKDFIYQRLTATVEEVIGHLERTLTEYEEEMQCRHRQLLDSERQDTLQMAEVEWMVIKDEVSSEQLNCSTNLEKEEPECTHIKKEKLFYCTYPEGEQLQGLHQGDVTKIPFAHVFVKNGDDEEKPQSAQRHQRQTEGNSEAEPPACSSTHQIKTERDCGKSEPGRISASGFKCLSGSYDKPPHYPDAQTEGSSDHRKETRKPRTDFSTLETQLPVNDMRLRLFSCFKCGKRFSQKHHLQTHMRCHTGERPFSCSVCGKRFTQKGNMTQHLTVHTRQKPCNCPVCGERFAQKGNLTQHMTVHTREKFR